MIGTEGCSRQIYTDKCKSRFSYIYILFVLDIILYYIIQESLAS